MVRQAIIPAAGLGTRMQPLTDGMAKEMLPLGNLPVLCHVLKEAVESQIREVVLVLSPQKKYIRDFLMGDKHAAWLSDMTPAGIHSCLQPLTIRYCYQTKPRGLMDALACGKRYIRDSHFAVLLPDNISVTSVPPVIQLQRTIALQPDCYYGGLLRLKGIHAGPVENMNNVSVIQERKHIYRITALHKKKRGARLLPANLKALKTFGRGIYPAGVFAEIARYKNSIQGEIDDVDILRHAAREHRFYAAIIRGTIFDVGNPEGYSRAWEYFRRFLKM